MNQLTSLSLIELRFYLRGLQGFHLTPQPTHLMLQEVNSLFEIQVKPEGCNSDDNDAQHLRRIHTVAPILWWPLHDSSQFSAGPSTAALAFRK